MTYRGLAQDTRPRRTVTKAELDASRAAWDAGYFSEEWRDWRHLAAMRAGIIVPPEGSMWDSWADDEPSERALLVRAIRETPAALRAALLSGRCHTWAQVIRELLQGRDRMADDAAERVRHERHDRSAEPSRADAAEALTAILGRLR